MTSVLAKIVRKAFLHVTKKNCLDTKIIQATSISFVYSFVGDQSGNRKKIHFSLLGSRSEHRFPARSRRRKSL